MSNRAKMRPGPNGRPRSAMARMVRKKCSDCGSKGIDWLTVGEAAARGVPVARFESLLVDRGGIEDIWLCRSCGESGAFGPDEFDAG